MSGIRYSTLRDGKIIRNVPELGDFALPRGGGRNRAVRGRVDPLPEPGDQLEFVVAGRESAAQRGLVLGVIRASQLERRAETAAPRRRAPR